MEVEVETRLRMQSKDTFARLYFFDSDRNLLKALPKPSVAKRKGRVDCDVPIFYSARKSESLFFAIPEGVTRGKWTAIAVFGDANEAVVKASAHVFLAEYDFPEKDLVLGKTKKNVDRTEAMDPVIELPVQSANSKQPLITLFLRFPTGVREVSEKLPGAGIKPAAAECKGVLALCLLASNVDQIRRRLQGIEMGLGVNALVKFAEEQHLAILAWGSRTLWNPAVNYDEMNHQLAREMDRSFDKVAEAWEIGVKQLGAQHGMSTKNFLLWGSCGSAQWAHRLALRKPDYFLAVHVHIPGSFDQPTPEAAKVLWCVTTGEVYGGYEPSKRFYADGRALGYPMVYKAIVGLGHAGSPWADALGLRFFEYALSLRSEREAYDEAVRKGRPPSFRPGENRESWPESFRQPAYVGDLLNQEMFPREEEEKVPEPFRVALPTREIAETWLNEPDGLSRTAQQ
ncbi:MAG: hypothetical protein IT578_02430 [Verrucomicrobiae bacterium]|nr:hypothetical protein [Verrucomicrobiae bacterium]